MVSGVSGYGRCNSEKGQGRGDTGYLFIINKLNSTNIFVYLGYDWQGLGLATLSLGFVLFEIVRQ
jgi:hypothetical protein